ncbi:MAG: molybdopterin-dependent oxidoreductase [Hyphomonadaceae bacterium]|nr:molybdopterin-dependent oxidoreductase [Hyphomonadaceae bacterium]
MEDTKTFFGACPHDCPDACGMIYKTEGDKLVSVKGNPDHPFTRGALCVKLNDFDAHHYNPDRILYPMKRTGPKGSRQFQRISWDEAIETIGAKWEQIIAESGPQAIIPYNYLGNSGVLNGLNVGDPFFNRMGATVLERTACGSAHIGGYLMTLGPSIGTDPESFVHSKTIVVWACNSVSTNLHHWRYLADARKRNGARIIVIDCVKSKTAGQADWHIMPKPGSDAALAMGIINVLRQDGLIDRDYVDQHTVGFEELMTRAAEFDLAYVEAETGVPAAEIRHLAHEMATRQPTAIRVGIAIERNLRGGQAMRAICCIPALTGAWRHVGGGILQSPAWAIPMDTVAMSRPDWIPEGTRVVNSLQIGRALTELQDPPIRSMMVFNANPAASAPDSERIREGLAREDLFTVVSEHFMTDTAAYADILLPATMAAEQVDIIVSWGHLYIAYNEAAIPAPGEAIPNTELFRRLATRMGYQDEILKFSDDELINNHITWDAPQLEGIDLDYLKTHGFARYQVGSPDELAPHAQGAFPTPSGKCEFVSEFASHGNFVGPPYRQGYTAMQDGAPLDPLPGYDRSEASLVNAGVNEKYPLRLLTPKSHTFVNTCYANEEDKVIKLGGRQVWLHPSDADQRGISNQAPVDVVGPTGLFSAHAVITEDVPPGVVLTPSGFWRPEDRSEGGTVNSLCSDELGIFGRAPTYNGNYVDVVLNA